MTPRAVARAVRPVAAPLAIVVLYAAAAILFERAAGASGLLTANGSVRPSIAALGALTLALRVATLFLAVPWLVGRAVSAAAVRFLARVRR